MVILSSSESCARCLVLFYSRQHQCDKTRLPVNNPLPRPRFPCSKRQGQQLGRRVVGNAPAVLDEEFGFNRLMSHENRAVDRLRDCAGGGDLFRANSLWRVGLFRFKNQKGTCGSFNEGLERNKRPTTFGDAFDRPPNVDKPYPHSKSISILNPQQRNGK